MCVLSTSRSVHNRHSIHFEAFSLFFEVESETKWYINIMPRKNGTRHLFLNHTKKLKHNTLQNYEYILCWSDLMHYAPTTKPLIKRTCTKPARKRLQFSVKVNHLSRSGYLVNSFGQGWSAFVIHFQLSVPTLRSVSRLFHVHSSCCTIFYIAFSTSSLKDAIKKSSPVIQGDSSS